MLSGLLITLFLVLLNGFFVAAEFAVVKVRASQLDIRIAGGSRTAHVAKSVIDNLDAYLSACQLGITIASLALGWVGESTVAHILIDLFVLTGLGEQPELAHAIAVPTAFIFISTLHIVLGEMAPKTLAIRHPEPTSLAIAIPLRLFYVVFRPFIWALNHMSNSLLRLFGIHPAGHDESHSEEELRILLEQSKAQGTIESSEHELIEKVFHFDDRVVHQIMVPRTRMMMLDVDASSEEILDTLFKEGYTRMPVYKDSRDNIIGIVHSRDLFRLARDKRTINLRDVLRPTLFVPETKKIHDLLREFQRTRMHMAIAVDEFGAPSGVVTLEDIVEELVGEIQDEYDEETPAVERRSENEYVVKAYASIPDVNKLLPVPLPEGNDYATVAGFLNIIYGFIPEVNRRKVFGSYEFTILKTSKRSVELVLLTLRRPESDDIEAEDETA